MGDSAQWLTEFGESDGEAVVDGLVPVIGYDRSGRDPEEVAIIEKAERYGADAVFFEASRDGKPQVAQAFVYRKDGPAKDPDFAELHQRLWSWGGVPLVYRVTKGMVQLFRCSHRADFEKNGEVIFKPFKTLKVAAQIASDPWWNAEQLRNGTLWDDPKVCQQLLSSRLSAQKALIQAVKDLHDELESKNLLPKDLRRKLLILSILITYIDERGVFEDGFFGRFLPRATQFFEVLANGPALVELLKHLEERFNGNVFVLKDEEREKLSDSTRLAAFATLVEARREKSGQLTLWKRYSFADLPVELISHIYQLFVKDTSVAVYTPHFVVRLMLGEVLSWERLDRLEANDEVIFDPACGSGIFLVEAYKRLVLHWRYRNSWKRPKQTVLKNLAKKRLRGVDLEEGAVELAAFSLCLAICDALEPEEIRASVKLFPPLKDKTIHKKCFFEASEEGVIKGKIGVVVGNPPFASKLATEGSKRAYQRYQEEHGLLPDKQVAYLFLHESMEMLEPGGVLSMLQQYNFLYNQKSLDFRRKFIVRWDVREILDFISVRGLFQKGGGDTKVVVVVAEAQKPPAEREILHATFRRSGRVDAEEGFDIDYYDMHWLPRELALTNDGVWRSDLLGGGRVLDFVNRMKKFRTLGDYADEMEWDYGEGYIVGKSGKREPAEHITKKPFLPSDAITASGINNTKIEIEHATLFRSSYTEARYSAPLLMVRQQHDLFHGIWTKSYLTYKDKIVGFCARHHDLSELKEIPVWLEEQSVPLRAHVAATSLTLYVQRSTSISSADITSLPYPESMDLRLTQHEHVLVEDIVNYYRDLIRLGEKSAAMKKLGTPVLHTFNDLFTGRINGVYKRNQLRALEEHTWPGVVCQPYVFGKGKVDWKGADELEEKIDALLKEERGSGLNVTRIARIYDGACIYLIKPDRLRYWLRSIALRDADETLADLAAQGF